MMHILRTADVCTLRVSLTRRSNKRTGQEKREEEEEKGESTFCALLKGMKYAIEKRCSTLSPSVYLYECTVQSCYLPRSLSLAVNYPSASLPSEERTSRRHVIPQELRSKP